MQQVGASSIPVEEKVAYCEAMYANYHTPAIFKISPLLDPAFDRMLEERGYEIQHTTEVMTMDLKKLNAYEPLSVEYEYYGRNSGLPSSIYYPNETIVQLRDRITEEWINSLFRLNGTSNPTLRRIVPSMFKAIPKETIVASVEIDGRTVAVGLGILDRGHVGLYAIYVDASCRRKGLGRCICSSILSEAKKKGAEHAYLQVVKGNVHAKHLYTTLGYEDFYTYWFRAKKRHRGHRMRSVKEKGIKICGLRISGKIMKCWIPQAGKNWSAGEIISWCGRTPRSSGIRRRTFRAGGK